MNTLAESRYAQSKREPLGKSIVRNYEFTYTVKKDGFRFGIPTKGYSNTKDLIYYGAKDEPENVKELYYKSHRVTDLGNKILDIINGILIQKILDSVIMKKGKQMALKIV